ncbi:MAG: hypothetical protein PHC88_03415 [Terrimicrobiaceae bacterium]|nr:hypothetical protein [Terrimicrobiaceae bacterium]
MTLPPRFLRRAILVAAAALPLCIRAASPAGGSAREIPEPLRPWESWALWGDDHRACPTPFSDATKHLCFWPSILALQIDAATGSFDLGVTVFEETWIPLPGGNDLWPLDVKANGAPLPVVEHEGHPAVKLPAGVYRLAGAFRWNEIPQSILLPREIGILALTLDGKPVEAPAWDAQGLLCLKRDASSEVADKDFLAVKVYAVIEDGIPLWLRTEIELIVSGKSREEQLGSILPAGWKLAAVDSPIPVAVDDAGRVKAQVRAGKWTLRVDAFRLDNPTEFRYAADAKPAVGEELVAFRARPDFRMVDIVGAPSVDVSQTTFPGKWRDLPVYQWDTAAPFRIEERMRGMGLQKPEGLRIARQLWLDDSGRGLTFRDSVIGTMQQIWRLDAAPGQDLGSVRSGGQGQLITRNPKNGAPGVEIRTRAIQLDATGRMARSAGLSATGWQSDADALNVTLNLPPGWRLFALFGADWVHGDWLTAWTLLDLFLLLIFSLAVFRLWGAGPAILAFLAFGLSYHEPGAPRYAWLVLLMPLALLRVVPAGWGRRLLVVWKWLAIAVLVFVLVPFVARQVQQALYPQLENVGPQRLDAVSAAPEAPREFAENATMSTDAQAGVAREDKSSEDGKQQLERPYSFGTSSMRVRKSPAAQNSNLLYDANARIQTGPGVPDWSWRIATFGWNGPVLASQQVHPVLISLPLERLLTVLRIALLLALAAVLLNARRLGGSLFRVSRASAALWIFALCAAATARAEFPDETMLTTLRERLLEPSDAYPTAAAIPFVSLGLKDRHLSMDAEIHAAIRTAVPLPGRLPAWSPVSVLIDGKPDVALRRDDGYLWVVLPEGVHQVHVEGLLANVTEWEWTFQLKPHRVSIESPGWTFSGVRADGVPEQQVFFALKQKSTAGEAGYDRQDFKTVAAIDRNLELGLVWQVHTTVTRLSSPGKAIALRVPLLPGENVLSSNVVAKGGFIEVRLGARDPSFTWESELSVSPGIRLATKADDSWVERWSLVASPVWNVAISGLSPTFEPGNPELVPVWHPWPGEGASLAISRPAAIAGATVTVGSGTHETTIGKRQRASTLDLAVRCSLGEDFLVDLPADAEITSLTQNNRAIPVRKDGTRLIVPLRPGEQSVSIAWKTNTPLAMHAAAGTVRLPVESANIETVLNMPDDRWILWTDGPLRGPAVRFWSILVCALLAAIVLGRVALSPLRPLEWMLLAIGLTQVPLPAAVAVVGWLFFLVWRGRDSFLRLPAWVHNLLQLFLIALTAGVLGIFIAVVAAGLLGSPEMFIVGNGSTRTTLRWYQARCDGLLPRPGCLSVSIWWYRFLMLAWALWLAAALIRWLRWSWQQFSSGACFRRGNRKTPPPSPPAVAQR